MLTVLCSRCRSSLQARVVSVGLEDRRVEVEPCQSCMTREYHEGRDMEARMREYEEREVL